MRMRGGAGLLVALIGLIVGSCGSTDGHVQQPAAPTVAATRVDTDRDGIADPDDACPQDAEDANGYQDTDGCPDCRRELMISMAEPLVLASISFADGGATLRPKAQVDLDADAQLMTTHEEVRLVEVQGHAEPSESNPQALSDLRAEAVVAALVSRGVARTRLQPVGYAATKKRSNSDTRADNRRVDMAILQRDEPAAPSKGGPPPCR